MVKSESDMTESDHRTNPLLNEVIQKKHKAAESEANRSRALRMIPDLKVQIGQLLVDKLEPPKLRTVKVTHFMPSMRDFDGKIHYSTNLTATIPLLDSETTKVKIYSDGYPDAEDPNSSKRLNFKIDIEDLDRILLLESEGIIQSKEWQHEPFTHSTPIGPTHSWPAWSRSITTKDIEEYRLLLENLKKPGVTFKGSTPDIMKYDYEPIRKRFKVKIAPKLT